MAAFFSNVENRDATFGEFSGRDENGIANTNTSINLRNLLFYDGWAFLQIGIGFKGGIFLLHICHEKDTDLTKTVNIHFWPLNKWLLLPKTECSIYLTVLFPSEHLLRCFASRWRDLKSGISQSINHLILTKPEGHSTPWSKGEEIQKHASPPRGSRCLPLQRQLQCQTKL